MIDTHAYASPQDARVRRQAPRPSDGSAVFAPALFQRKYEVVRKGTDARLRPF